MSMSRVILVVAKPRGQREVCVEHIGAHFYSSTRPLNRGVPGGHIASVPQSQLYVLTWAPPVDARLIPLVSNSLSPLAAGRTVCGYDLDEEHDLHLPMRSNHSHNAREPVSPVCCQGASGTVRCRLQSSSDFDVLHISGS